MIGSGALEGGAYRSGETRPHHTICDPRSHPQATIYVGGKLVACTHDISCIDSEVKALA